MIEGPWDQHEGSRLIAKGKQSFVLGAVPEEHLVRGNGCKEQCTVEVTNRRDEGEGGGLFGELGICSWTKP